jgi:transcriptional regulator with XRE-family HTH domain
MSNSPGIFAEPVADVPLSGNYCTMTVITHPTQPVSMRAVVAERLRMAMAARRISQIQLCEKCEWGRGYMNRRYIGETPLDVDDLATLEVSAGISMHYLLTGDVKCIAPHPNSTVGNNDSSINPAQYLRTRILTAQQSKRPQSLPLPCKDSNLKPFGLRSSHRLRCQIRHTVVNRRV